jgi:hypothetical protein
LIYKKFLLPGVDILGLHGGAHSFDVPGDLRPLFGNDPRRLCVPPLKRFMEAGDRQVEPRKIEQNELSCVRQVQQKRCGDPVKPSPRSPRPRSPDLASEDGGEGMAANPLGEPERVSGCRLQALALHVFQQRHIDVAVVFLPGLVLLRSQRSYEPQATCIVREDSNDARAPFDL